MNKSLLNYNEQACYEALTLTMDIINIILIITAIIISIIIPDSINNDNYVGQFKALYFHYQYVER